ncbi:hypothetical protein PENSPDRAFT_758380 [Peniophora sp. CONT]|nr:hypothetical protein PENSPDRAFT_758380 [Peniophora sp. CONT]
MALLVNRLPYDIYLLIFLCLHDLRDVLALKQVNRVLHACGSSEYLWHRLYARLHVPLDVSPSIQISELSGSELQQLIIRAKRLEHNWKRPYPKIRRYRFLKCSYDAAIDEMFLLNRARWLVTAQRTRRNGAPLAHICLWALGDSNSCEPYCAASLEIPGRYRKIAAVVDDERELATFAVTTDADRQNDDILQVHELHLLQRHETYGSTRTHTDARTRAFGRPNGAKGIIQDLAAEGDLVAAVFIDFDAEFPGDAYQIFLINTQTWATELLHPTFDQPVNRLNLRLMPNRIILVGATADTIVLRGLALPAEVINTTDQLKFQYRPTGEDGDRTVDDLGFLTSLAISSCPNPIDSDTLIFHSMTAPDVLSLLFVDLQDTMPGHGHLVRLFFNHEPSEAEDRAVTGSIRQDRPFPMPPETTVKLVRIGASGRRAVWIEHDWEFEETRVMRAHFPAEDPEAASVSVLIPAIPVNPALPFTPRAAQSLAFDETTGRLCLGLYDGVVWILDYN